MLAGSARRPRAALLPRASLVAAVAVGLVAGPAGAQEAEAPLMIQTVPAVEGVELSLFGVPVATDAHGLAVATGTPGTYELSTPDSGARDDTRWEFSGWSDGIESPSRTVRVASFTFLEAGYDVYHRVSPSLVEAGGGTITGAVDSITLVDDRAERVTLDNTGFVWLLAQRAVETPTGLATEGVGYRVESIVADGRDLATPGAQEIRPVAGERLEIVARPSTTAPAPLPTPRDEVAARQPSRAVESPGAGVVGWLILLVIAGAGVLAYARRVGSVAHLLPGWPDEPWGAGVRRAGAGALERVARVGSGTAQRGRQVGAVVARAGGGVVVLVARVRRWGGAGGALAAVAARARLGGRARRGEVQSTGAETAAEEREYVRVSLLDGRVIEGWWERQEAGAGGDFFCLTHVSRVLGPEGKETVSTPVDAFIPVVRIADIERAENPGSGEVVEVAIQEDAGRRDNLTSTG